MLHIELLDNEVNRIIECSSIEVFFSTFWLRPDDRTIVRNWYLSAEDTLRLSNYVITKV